MEAMICDRCGGAIPVEEHKTCDSCGRDLCAECFDNDGSDVCSECAADARADFEMDSRRNDERIKPF